MDCKSPMFLLADMSVRKHAEAAQRSRTQPIMAPNFDEAVDSPGLPLSRKRPSPSDSPFAGISRRFTDHLPNSSPLSHVMANASSPQSGGSAAMAQSPPLTHRSDSGDSSPSVNTSKNFADLAEIKASPRIDVLMQAAECSENQKKKRQPPNPEKKSQFRGVSWQKTSRAWVAQYKSNGRTTYLGLFATEEDAAKAYDVAVFVHSLGSKMEPRLNFGRPDQEIVDAYIKNGKVPPGRLGATAPRRVEEKVENPSEPGAAAPGDSHKDKHVTSNYRGVSWYAARQIWKASIQVNRKKEYIGRFETEEEAARAYNRRALELRGRDAILNQVPDTVTRYPPGEVPLPAEELERNIEQAKSRKKEGGVKRKSDPVAAKADVKKPKPLASNGGNKKSSGGFAPTTANTLNLNSAIRSSVFNTLPPSTPDLASLLATPSLFRLADSELKSLNPVPPPAFHNVDDEMERALRGAPNENAFDIPQLFASPMPASNVKRTSMDTVGAGAPMTGMNNHGTSFTPMFHSLFDSPLPQMDNGSLTPSDLAPYRLNMSTGPRRGRKTFMRT